MFLPKRIFYGWIVVFCGIILTALGIGMLTNTNSLFVKPVCDSLGFERGQFTLYRTIIQIIGAVTMPLYGRLIRRIGVKRVFLAGVLMPALVSIGYSFSTRLWHFYLLASVSGLFINGISFLSIGVLISAWFNGKKGLATGLAYSGSGLGGAIMIPVIGRIIELMGWQWGYRFMGILSIAVSLPVIIIFVKNAPKDIGLVPLAPDKSSPKTGQAVLGNYSFKEALCTLKFWLVAAAVSLFNFFSSASNTHFAAYLSDLGYMPAYISSVLSLYLIFVTIGKIILGSVYDRFGALTGNLVISVFCLGFPIFALLSHIPWAPWVFAVSLGIATCGVSIPASILASRYFGDKDFSVIFSFYMMASVLSPSVSVPAMGAVYDRTGSYVPAWIAFLFCSVIISACLIGAEILGRRDSGKALARNK